MALTEYKKKRSFNRTPEPEGGKSNSAKLHFVVQKHHASHLHYDFRLEMRGVLKSWAVPKGPSMDPKVTRLAMMVEDHPYDYMTFEGKIPEGNYGAGTVIVWDIGTYTPTGEKVSKKESESKLLSSLYKGKLQFDLHGKKLKGSFVLVKSAERGPTSWLLKKVKDKYATSKDIALKDKSVVSGLTLEDMAAKKNAETWISNRTSENNNPPRESKNNTDTIEELVQSGKKTAFPEKVRPMLATKIEKPFTDAEWLYEVKWDGYRVLAHVKNQKATLRSREGLNYTKQYQVVAEALSELAYDVVLDGEIVTLDNEGKPNFDLLQKYAGSSPLIYYVFDVTWCNGYSLRDLSLLQRKEILQQLLPESEVIRYSDHFDDGIALYDQVEKMKMEGIVAKKRDSEYTEGKRSNLWLKIPTSNRQEFVVGGWTESDSGRPFRSILFGNYQDNELHWVGHAGGGFKEKEMPSILKELKKLEVKKSPFVNEVDAETKVHWIKPELVADIRFATFTASKKIRKPATFLGFRKDKKPTDVVPEKIITPKEIPDDTKPSKEDTTASDSNWPKIKAQKITSEDIFTVARHRVKINNVEQELWKGVLKADLISYYHSVSRYMLPHLKDRPQSLHIKNNGPYKPGFYIKDMEGNEPSWSKVFTVARKHKKPGKRDQIDYLVCNNEATLLYMVNLGCIDINPWTSRTDNYLYPDYIVIDLDPSDEDFRKAVDTALAAKEFFTKQKLTAFSKTSGKTGIHLYIPCRGFTFPEARTIAENICSEIHSLVPEITTTEVTVSRRGDKLYIDPNQNDEADTVAAPYSVRPFHHPTVSTPLEWKEIGSKLNSTDFTITTLLKRIRNKGDIFKKVLSEEIAAGNNRSLKKLLP
jgi:bifunctional non-homologous end joining protein LigD